MRFWYNHLRSTKRDGDTPEGKPRFVENPEFFRALHGLIDEARSTGQIRGYPFGPGKIYGATAVTACEIRDGDDVLVRGLAFCRDDMFSRRLGREIARNRALKLLALRGLEFVEDERPTEEAPAAPC